LYFSHLPFGVLPAVLTGRLSTGFIGAMQSFRGSFHPYPKPVRR
jgi:hypothetical protein